MGAKARKFDIIPLLKIATLAVFVALILACTLLPSGAWFELRDEVEGEANYGNAAATADIYFLKEGVRYESAAYRETNRETIRIEVRPEMEAEINYIGNLRINIDYRGVGAFYLRVRILDQWTYTGGGGEEIIERGIIPPYGLDDNLWIDNRRSDFCYYFHDDLTAAQKTGPYAGLPTRENPYMVYQDALVPGQSLTFPFISQPLSDEFLQSYFRPGMFVRLYVAAEIVQANRYQQLWGIDAMPTR